MPPLLCFTVLTLYHEREPQVNTEHWIVPVAAVWGARPESSLKFNSWQVKYADCVKCWSSAPTLSKFSFRINIFHEKESKQNIYPSKKIFRTASQWYAYYYWIMLPLCKGKAGQAIVSSTESTDCREFLQLSCFVYIKYHWGQSSARLEMLGSRLCWL